MIAEKVNNKLVLKDQIWFGYLPEIEGNKTVIYGHRPLLIISNNFQNVYSENVKIVPITSNLDKLKYSSTLLLKAEETGLLTDSVALFDYIITLDKEHLYKQVGKIPIYMYKDVDNLLQKQLQR